MANRILRDWTCSETIDTLSQSAEVFFTRLIMKADDFGRFYGSVRLLKANLFPLKDFSFQQIEDWRNEVVSSGIVIMYVNDGKEYLEIKDFNQRLRVMKSKFPDPKQSVVSQMTVNCQSNDGLKQKQNTEVETEKNLLPNGSCQNENFDKAHKGEKIDFTLLLEFYNKTFGKQARIVNDKVKRAYNARMKDGYLKEDIQKAMQVCKLNDFHKSNDFQYCTLEFFSRSDTLDKYATVGDKSQKPVYSPR